MPPKITMIEACYGPAQTEQLKPGCAPKSCVQCGKDAGITHWNLWRMQDEFIPKPLCRFCEAFVEWSRDLISRETPEDEWHNIEILPNRSQVEQIKQITKRNG